MSKAISNIDFNEFYSNFLEECKAVIVESVFASREELLKGKWELGKMITEKEGMFEAHEKIYGKRIVERMAVDLKRSKSDIWRCVQFYKTYPQKRFSQVMEKLPEGKAISWHKVITKYLPQENVERTRSKMFMKAEVPRRGQEGTEPVVDNEYFSFINKMNEPVTVKIYVKRPY